MLTFDKPARLSTDDIWDHVSTLSKAANCSEVFGEEMMAALGTPDICTWSQDHRNMCVPLGYNATLLLNENLVINGTLVPLGNMAWPGPPETMSPLFTQQDFDMSSADLSANVRITRSCSWLCYTSTNLTGDAGRPYKALWSFGPQTPEPMRQSLAGVLANASQQDLLELAISPAEFNAAVDAVAQQIGELDIVRLEIIVTITNWLGESTAGNASTWIQLDQAPQVVPVGSTSVQIFNREEVEFNMQTELRESFECSDASRYNRRITVDWEYSSSNTTGWVKLSEVYGLEDRAFSPFTLSFAAFSFEPETSHYFRATAYFQGLDPSIVENTQVLQFAVHVKQREAPIALVSGPSETSINCGFVVSAQASQDPSLPSSVTPDFRYRWSCFSSLGVRDRVCQFLDSASSDFSIPGGILQEGLFTFRARVWRSFETEADASNASITVSLSASAPPPVVITTPGLNGSGVSTTMGWSTGPVANIMGSSTCAIPAVGSFRWALVSSTGTILSINVPQGSWNSSYASLSLASSTFDGSTLTVGEQYEYVFIIGLQDDTITLLDNNVLGSLTSAAAAGAFLVRSSPFLADGPPRDGQVQADPAEGFAVETKFKLNALDWVDESVPELQYAFYQFTESQLSFTTPFDITIATNTIVWDNSTDSNYWVSLQGILLQDWSKSATCETILPIGNLITILRVRDQFGASSVSGLRGPVVTAPLGGVDPTLASAALGSAVALNEANSILNAVAAVSSVSVAGSDAESRAVVDASMTALEAAAELAPPDASTLQKVGGVVTAALSSGSAGTQDKSTLSRATDVLGTVLNTATAATAVVTEDAGNAMLGSLLTITTANTDGGGDPEQSAAVTAKALDLVSKLGQVMLNSVPANGTLTLSSLDAQGRGSETELAKSSTTDVDQNGLTASGVSIPASGRRLQSAPACSEVGLQYTQWIASNPYSWANDTLGINSNIASNATVSVLELSRCGVVVGFPTFVEVAVAMPGDAESPTDTPTCVIFDTGKGEWVTDNISLVSANKETYIAQCSTISSGTYALYYRHTPLQETENFSTIIAIAFTVPLVLVASSLAKGAIYLMRKRAIEKQHRKKKVYPEKEKPPLQEVVTEEPPGGDTDVEEPGPDNTEGGDTNSPSRPIIAFEEGRNSAALHALRRHSYGEVAHPPLPPSRPNSSHSQPHLDFPQGLLDPSQGYNPIQGWPSPQGPSPSGIFSSSPVHVSPVRVIHRSRSQSREQSVERPAEILLPGSIPGEIPVPVHTQSRRSRSREPSTSVRVVRRNDNMDTVGAAQTLLRATAQAAADAVLQPPSMSSTAAPSEVSTATVRRVVGTRVDPKTPTIQAVARVSASPAPRTSSHSNSPVRVSARRAVSETPSKVEAASPSPERHRTSNVAASSTSETTAASTASVRVVARKIRRPDNTERECVAKARRAEAGARALSPIHSNAQSPKGSSGFPTLLSGAQTGSLSSTLSHSTLT